ncbi:MAG TPA: patatin-like phospholipase family protein [Allosphingosinicella sp.]
MRSPSLRSHLSTLPRCLAAAFLILVAAGCSTPQRLSAVPAARTVEADPGIAGARFLPGRDVIPLAEEARAAQGKEQAWLASQGHEGPLPPAYYLAISGGGDEGAFGAGLLTGWTAAGNRPQFKVVTGISTGALSAPFAFLGPDYDSKLEEVYTQVSQRDIFKTRGAVRGFLGDAMADSAPLKRLVARHVDRKLLDAIAAEYAKGRLMLVGTADLDSLEPVVWNMTAIAASPDPRAPQLFRDVLVASASIPGLFPPVMIDVTLDGVRHQEMHVDGGAIAQLFLYPPSLPTALGEPVAQRRRTLYLIRNSQLRPAWANVKRQTLPIASRAVDALIRTQGVGDLYRIYVTSRRDGLDYNLAYIPPSFTTVAKAPFDTGYMRSLYALGRDLAVKGYGWSKMPPGYDEAEAAR